MRTGNNDLSHPLFGMKLVFRRPLASLLKGVRGKRWIQPLRQSLGFINEATNIDELNRDVQSRHAAKLYHRICPIVRNRYAKSGRALLHVQEQRSSMKTSSPKTPNQTGKRN